MPVELAQVPADRAELGRRHWHGIAFRPAPGPGTSPAAPSAARATARPESWPEPRALVTGAAGPHGAASGGTPLRAPAAGRAPALPSPAPPAVPLHDFFLG